MKEPLLRRVHALFLVMFVVTLGVSAMAVRTISRSMASSDWVNQTHSLIFELDGMIAGLQSGEGLMRSYVFTADPRDFSEAYGALTGVQDHLTLAKALGASDPTLVQTLTKLEGIAAARVAFADSLRQAKEQGGTERLKQALEADAGSTQSIEFRREVTRLRDRQFELLGERDRASYRQAQETRWVVGLGAGVNFLVFVAVLALVREDIANRKRMTAALQAANDSLEQRVRERTAELTEANRRLTAENLERKWTAVSQEHQLRYNQLIVNSVSDLVFVLTKALNVTRVNPAVARFTAHDEEAVLGRPLAQFLRFAPDPTSPVSLEAVTRALHAGRETAQVPAELLDHAGRATPVTVFFVPLRDNDQVVGAVAVVHRAASTPTA